MKIVFWLAARSISLLVVVPLLAQNVVKNPQSDQQINQPSGTYLSPNRMTVTEVLAVPGNGSQPQGTCRNGRVNLQQMPVPQKAVLWRCNHQEWERELGIVPGLGMKLDVQSGQQILSVDTAVVSIRVLPPSEQTTPCTSGMWAMDATYAYFCYAQNTWGRIAYATWTNALPVAKLTIWGKCMGATSPASGCTFMDSYTFQLADGTTYGPMLAVPAPAGYVPGPQWTFQNVQ